MPRRSWLFLPLVAALVGWSATAQASLDVRIAVSPSTIAQCDTGHFFVAIGNTGTTAECSLIHFQLSYNGSPVGTGFSHVLCLPAGAHRSFEGTFIVPPLAPTGSYALTLSATSKDGSTSTSTASFTVVAGTCPRSPSSGASTQSIATGIAQTLGLTPDATAPKDPTTWGRLHQTYR